MRIGDWKVVYFVFLLHLSDRRRSLGRAISLLGAESNGKYKPEEKIEREDAGRLAAAHAGLTCSWGVVTKMEVTGAGREWGMLMQSCEFWSGAWPLSALLSLSLASSSILNSAE